MKCQYGGSASYQIQLCNCGFSHSAIFLTFEGCELIKSLSCNLASAVSLLVLDILISDNSRESHKFPSSFLLVSKKHRPICC